MWYPWFCDVKFNLNRVLLFLLCASSPLSAATQAPNIDGIINTRHNLTQSFLDNPEIMNIARNNYAEVCVYCHTPHAANKQVDAPLWNRTINTGTYQVYSKPRSLNRPISQPGPNSLTCLSCHDGTIAIDSIINMPGSGRYREQQETQSDTGFLDTWSNNTAMVHATMGPDVAPGNCTFCHNPDGGPTGRVPNFVPFVVGTDLNSVHPIGVLYPDNITPAVSFNDPPVKLPGEMAIFDINADGYAFKNEVRLYDSGDGFEVECASCHDPHGVPENGPGSTNIIKFLRVTPSALCLTCHDL